MPGTYIEDLPVDFAARQIHVEHVNLVVPKRNLPVGSEKIGAIDGAFFADLDGDGADMKPDAQAPGEGREMRDGFGFFLRRDPLEEARGFGLHQKRIFRGLYVLSPLSGGVAYKSLGLQKIISNVSPRPHLNEGCPKTIFVA